MTGPAARSRSTAEPWGPRVRPPAVIVSRSRNSSHRITERLTASSRESASIVPIVSKAKTPERALRSEEPAVEEI